MTADLHAHVIVPEILLDAEPSEEWRPRVYREDGAQVVEMGGRPIRAAIEEFVDVDAILEHQAKAGIDMTVLAPWVPLLFYDAEPGGGPAPLPDPERRARRRWSGRTRAASAGSARCRSRIPSWPRRSCGR